jgi:hypothetical protein
MHPRRTLVAFVTVLLLTLASCSWFTEGEQFKLVSTPSGDLYRLQVSTGQMHKVAGTTLVPVTNVGRVQLQVGAIYLFESGSTMKYAGEGKFEPFKSEVLTLDEYLKSDGAKEKLEGYMKSQGGKK